MIEKMKKFTFLVTDREYDGFIESIRELGVVHVTQLQQGATSTELQEAIYLEQRYARALDFLKIYGTKYALKLGAVAPEYDTPLSLLQKVEDLQVQENVLLHEEDELKKEFEMLEPWGDFSPEKVQRLSETIGMEMHFFRCTSKRFKAEWLDNFFAVPVNEYDKKTYFVTFSESRPEIAAEHITLPQKSLSQVHAEIGEVKKQKFMVRQQMSAVANALLPVLEEGMLEVRNDISLNKVHLSSEKTCGDVLHLMLGWVRADSTAPLTEYLDKSHIYYEMQDPAYEDDVPVQITNGRFSRLFEPILKMYSLPNYTDLDPTEFFAPFFMLFFGLCMGDAGYGLLIFLVGLFLALKGAQDMKPYGRLAMWLGGTTVVCGLVCGTLFGIDLTQQSWAFLEPVKPYFLNDNGVGPIFGYSPMMVISVIIGLVQVLLGMILKGCKAIKNYGWPYAVGTFSWVAALLGAIVLYGLPACGVELAMWVQYLLMGIIGISALGIFLYNNPASYKKPVLGVLSNIGGGVWETYGMATGLLGDLLSYIRLFALGLTGGVLGGVFNSLALDMTATMPLWARIIVMVLILLFGHGITFALSMISAFVHPMRLTFVEFFKNADFAGGGKEYDPFRKLK
ncbi:MAG: V-type ATP synthase subunit I [Bacteroidaceae bacterium]|nr:V-type ATP synthase subunit I [Bacteroidaceae bacterium]